MIIANETRRGFIRDTTLAAFVFMETPLGFNPKSKGDAFVTPGCHLKTAETEGGPGTGREWPKHFGRLTEIDKAADVVTVLGKKCMADDGQWVWIGSQVEYETVWRCD